MSMESPHSDGDLLDLLRVAGPLSVAELSHAMEVTATAVRQRLTRLLGQTLIQRETIRSGRGRPKHRYYLSDKGLRFAGSNFTDLVLVLWRELNSILDEDARRQMLRRVARTLAAGYAEQVQGQTPAERMRSLSALMEQRKVPVSVENSDGQATLTAHACPYPKLAEEDRDICAVEKIMFSELLGNDVELTQCRLDGGCECRFQTT